MNNIRKEFEQLNHKQYLKMECVNCGSSINLQLHHIVPIAKGGTNSAGNLVTLCGDCHAIVHNHSKALTAEWKELQRLGVERAKTEGKYKGRKPIEIDDTIFQEYYNKYMARKITKVQMAKELEISRPTLDKLLKKYNDKIIE